MPQAPQFGVPDDENLDWMAEAECVWHDPELFFHPSNEKGLERERRAALAKAVCDYCPVMFECRDYSLRSREQYGVWGGLAEGERPDSYVNRSNPGRRYSA